MGRVYSEAQKRIQHDVADEILAYLETIRDSDNWRELLIDHIEAMTTERESQASTAKAGRAWDFSTEKAQPGFACDGDLRLRPFNESDKHFYYCVRRQWDTSSPKSMFDENLGILWKHATEENAFFCVVEWKGQPVGYVAIHDTRAGTWELGVEFDKEYCYKGFGPKSILMFLRTLEEITMISLFRARVEVDNLACQKCMAKIGAALVGLSDGILKTDEEKRLFEDENLDRIDDHMRMLAKELNVEPRALLSHVFEYEIQV